MRHNAAFHQGLHCYYKKYLHTKIYYLFLNYNLTPLVMYNGLPEVYCIKPDGRIHLCTKWLRYYSWVCYLY